MKKELEVIPNATIVDVLNDGFREAEEYDCQGFEYVVGTVRGGTVKVVFEPDDNPCFGSACIDAGFGLCMVIEVEK